MIGGRRRIGGGELEEENGETTRFVDRGDWWMEENEKRRWRCSNQRVEGKKEKDVWKAKPTIGVGRRGGEDAEGIWSRQTEKRVSEEETAYRITSPTF